jgi:acyl-CoA synthetase (AMP-forming)/AMP-acid ligase II
MALVSAARAAATPDDIALVDQRQALTWVEFDRILNRAATALLSLGLAEDQRVAVFAENAVETALAHLAGILVGVSTVPVNFHLTVSEVAYILEDSGAAAVFAGPETVAVARDAAAETGVRTVVAWRSDDAGVIRWDDWLARGVDEEPPTDMPPRPFLHYTSGTTGRPKGVETPPAMFAGGKTIREHFATVAPDPFAGCARGPTLVVSPLYHTGPLTALRALAAGIWLVILGRFDAEATLAAIDRYGVSHTLMVPTHFQRLLALPEPVRLRYDVSSLQQVIHTGAACPIDVKRRMIDWLGPILFEAYGATESGSATAITSAEWLEHPGSVGRAIPPFELLILDDAGNELGPGESGRVCFRDPSGRGIVYHRDPEKTAAAHVAEGVFALGEIGYRDADGFLYITDRQSDMVVSGGVNLYPAEAEQALVAHPAVADVAVIGVPDEEMGEALKALVVTSSQPPPDPAELDAFCRSRLAGFKCPRSYEFVADVGRTAMGKLDKRALRRPYWPTERTIAGGAA